MSAASLLATTLDQEMLEIARSVLIANRTIADKALEIKTGGQVASELGGRYLIRYVMRRQVGTFMNGTTSPQFVTPTPYASNDLVSWLALPAPLEPRPFALLLDPSRLGLIQGPRWVRLGRGIEYLLPQGFPKEALVFAWEVEVA